jgi:hypothetical protein
MLYKTKQEKANIIKSIFVGVIDHHPKISIRQRPIGEWVSVT